MPVKLAACTLCLRAIGVGGIAYLVIGNRRAEQRIRNQVLLLCQSCYHQHQGHFLLLDASITLVTEDKAVNDG